jgi:hypothetical protein
MSNRLKNILTAVEMATAANLEHAADWLRRQCPEHFETVEEAHEAISAGIANPEVLKKWVDAEAGTNLAAAGAGSEPGTTEDCTGEDGTAVAGAGLLAAIAIATADAPAAAPAAFEGEGGGFGGAGASGTFEPGTTEPRETYTDEPAPDAPAAEPEAAAAEAEPAAAGEPGRRARRLPSALDIASERNNAASLKVAADDVGEAPEGAFSLPGDRQAAVEYLERIMPNAEVVGSWQKLCHVCQKCPKCPNRAHSGIRARSAPM